MSIAAIIVAAGRGVRAGGDIPKQYQVLSGQPVLLRSINALARHADVSQMIVVINSDDQSLFDELVAPHLSSVDLTTVVGGETRAISVRNGLQVIDTSSTNRILVHDGARPLVSSALIARVVHALQAHPAAAPALAVSDALWRGADGVVVETQDRSNLYRAQTPQGFRAQVLIDAYLSASDTARDEVEVVQAAGISTHIVAGDERNIKITTPEDFQRAAHFLGNQMDIRTGNGFDVHAMTEGDHVVLCGVKIPLSHALLGHSDADVAMHAVTDAIYGALAAGDIGQWFPPSDDKWKGAESSIFLEHAVGLAAERGFSINHVDCTIVCELPKIGPHAKAMRQNMGEIMGLELDRISVKATTSEKLGFTGRGEGISALATATLVSS